MSVFHDFTPRDHKGSFYPLNSLRGKVVLVVNTASECGFTAQLEGLQTLCEEIKTQDNDFGIIGFPCNQFAALDLGSYAEIQSFCQMNYNVTFPILGKQTVNDNDAESVWKWMKQCKPGICGLKHVKWNFAKFLIGRDGLVKGRWASTTKPEAVKMAVESELRRK